MFITPPQYIYLGRNDVKKIVFFACVSLFVFMFVFLWFCESVIKMKRFLTDFIEIWQDAWLS